MATLKLSEENGHEDEVPPEIAAVLKEFEDVMPKELPKQLPPRREVDHKIELVPWPVGKLHSYQNHLFFQNLALLRAVTGALIPRLSF